MMEIFYDGNPLESFEQVGTDPIFTFSGKITAVSLLDVPLVPEPSTWTMLLIGFAGVGFLSYRRRTIGTIVGG